MFHASEDEKKKDRKKGSRVKHGDQTGTLSPPSSSRNRSGGKGERERSKGESSGEEKRSPREKRASFVEKREEGTDEGGEEHQRTASSRKLRVCTCCCHCQKRTKGGERGEEVISPTSVIESGSTSPCTGFSSLSPSSFATFPSSPFNRSGGFGGTSSSSGHGFGSENVFSSNSKRRDSFLELGEDFVFENESGIGVGNNGGSSSSSRSVGDLGLLTKGGCDESPSPSSSSSSITTTIFIPIMNGKKGEGGEESGRVIAGSWGREIEKNFESSGGGEKGERGERAEKTERGEKGEKGERGGEKMVKLNVGGRRYVTSWTTLASQGENMLTRMLERHLDGSLPSLLDEDGYVYVDRDGDAFAVVLNFLRTGKLLPPKDMSMDLIKEEMSFYQILVTYPNDPNDPKTWLRLPMLCRQFVKSEVVRLEIEGNKICKNGGYWLRKDLESSNGTVALTVLANETGDNTLHTFNRWNRNPRTDLHGNPVNENLTATRADMLALTGLVEVSALKYGLHFKFEEVVNFYSRKDYPSWKSIARIVLQNTS